VDIVLKLVTLGVFNRFDFEAFSELVQIDQRFRFEYNENNKLLSHGFYPYRGG
jgi:hypothetical protein